MTYRGDADRSFVVGQLVEDPVPAHPQRPQSSQPAAKEVTGVELALEQADRVLDGTVIDRGFDIDPTSLDLGRDGRSVTYLEAVGGELEQRSAPLR